MLRATAAGILLTSTVTALPALAEQPGPAISIASLAKQPIGEIPGAATESRRVTRGADGRVTIETWARPVRVKQGNSSWAWIDTNLAESNGSLSPRVTKTPVLFSTGGGGNKPLVQMNVGRGKSLALGWPRALPLPAVSGNTAKYADAVAPGVDLFVSALPTGFRYAIVLNRKPAEELQATLPLSLTGLSSKGTQFLDSEGRPSVHVTQPHLMAAPSKNRTAQSTRPKVDSKLDAGGVHLTVNRATLDEATYPLTVTASYSTEPSADVDVADDGGLADPTLPLMTAGTIFGLHNRTYLRFDGQALIGQDIIDANLSLLNTDGPACGDPVGAGIQARRITSRWDAADLTWANTPSATTEGAATVTASHASDCGPDRLTWPLKDIAKAWAGGESNYGIVLQAPDESDPDDNFRVLASSEYGTNSDAPKLTVVYQPAPTPIVLYPAGPDGVEVFTAPANWRMDTLPMDSITSDAVGGAAERVTANSSLLAYPYFDANTNKIVIPAVAGGRDIAGQILAGTAIDEGWADSTLPGEFESDTDTTAQIKTLAPLGVDYSVAPQVVDVANSQSALVSVVDEAMDLDAVLTGGDNIFGGTIWPERNLAIIESTVATPELRRGLADRYGLNKVVIWLRSEDDRPVQLLDNRRADTGPVNGGSYFTAPNKDPKLITECSTGFAMGSSGDNLMLTAGHCTSTRDVNASIGQILWSNHPDDSGTVKLPGQSTYYGDLALIWTRAQERITSPTIFVGNEVSTAKRWVSGKSARRAQSAQSYCVGGWKTGETCGWKIAGIAERIEIKGQTGPTRWLQHGDKWFGKCTDHGDSGGPVYSVRPDGMVVAKGILSSAASTGPVCDHWFTDIYDGVLATGKDVLKAQ